MQGMQAPAANGEGYGASTAASPSPRLDGQLRNLLGTFWAVRVASWVGRGEPAEAAEGQGQPGAPSDSPDPSPVLSSRTPGSPSARAAGI